jgi:hypothetical protein
MQKLSRLKMEPWRAVDAQNDGVEAQNRGLKGLYASGRRYLDEKQEHGPGSALK